MAQSPKSFAERLHQCLDEMGAPQPTRERAVVLSKMLSIPKQYAWGLLEGQQKPDQALLTSMAQEFEVDPSWLSGEMS